MGFFDSFLKKTLAAEGSAASTATIPPRPVTQFIDTPESFQPMADNIVPPLVDMLLALSDLEEEIGRRFDALNEKKLAMGIPRGQVAPGWEELWAEYRTRFYAIAAPLCTEKLLNRGYARSCGYPTEYGYLAGECQLFFTMNSNKRAMVVTRYHESIDKAHQFVLRPIDGIWKIDKVSYSYGNEPTWHITEI